MVSLSVIIPAYNEEDGIIKAIERNNKVLKSFALGFEIIIINDGSTDKTLENATTSIKDYTNNIIISKKNGGFGSAIKEGIKYSNNEYILYVPVDSPLTIEVFSSFYINLGKADLLISYRKQRKGYTSIMLLNAWIYRRLVSLLFNLKIKDYNWIHCYKKDVFKSIIIEDNGFFMLAEVIIKSAKMNFSIIEFPVEMIKRTTGFSSASSLKVILKTFIELIKFYIKTKKYFLKT